MSSAAAESDHTIVTRVRAGDERAFAELFRRYYEPVIRFVYRYVHSMDTARDVTQDLFIRCWEKRTGLPDENISAYLFRAARNGALNVLKHDEVAARWEARVELEAPHGGEDAAEVNEDIAAQIRQAL